MAPLPAIPRRARQTPRVVVDPCTVVTRYKQDLSSPKDGQLLSVGRYADKSEAG